ncbi:MAG: hypothetical protein ACI9SC_003087 [Gammaproteobacteria bacterium]|jgi:hypothetical protein
MTEFGTKRDFTFGNFSHFDRPLYPLKAVNQGLILGNIWSGRPFQALNPVPTFILPGRSSFYIKFQLPLLAHKSH